MYIIRHCIIVWDVVSSNKSISGGAPREPSRAGEAVCEAHALQPSGENETLFLPHTEGAASRARQAIPVVLGSGLSVW
jgi:hypothetical protein